MINMLGRRAPQASLFEADTLYLDFVGRDTFYGFLARQRGVLFCDKAFAKLYCKNNGRNSVPPSLLATALVLQTYDGASDEEARQRATYDVRWKVALGVELDRQPFAKSTLQEFRARLIAHKESRAVFEASLALAQKQGWLDKNRKLKAALDTTNILGRGAVKDTYHLLADGMGVVLRVLAKQAGEPLEGWANGAGYGRYVSGSSLKGQAAINWDNAAERQRFLAEIVADADRLLETVRVARGQVSEGSAEDVALREAAGLLSRVLVQDIERKPSGPELKQQVTEDRMPSVHDPEMRHGHKSKSKRFDGHKAHIVADTDSQLILAADVAAGNAGDAEPALTLIEQTEANTGCTVEEAIGDCAYGGGETRHAFVAAGRTLVAKVPASTNQGCYPKTAFTIDPEAATCTCPAGQVTDRLRTKRRSKDHTRQEFQFAAAVCRGCPQRGSCVRGQRGRTIQLHPQEALLQAARAFQDSPAFREYRSRRQVVEHRLARLVQLGIRQARYRGRTKTLFQLLMAAAVANLTLLAQTGLAKPAATPITGFAVALALLLLATHAFWSRLGQESAQFTRHGRHCRILAWPHLLPLLQVIDVTSRPGF